MRRHAVTRAARADRARDDGARDRRLAAVHRQRSRTHPLDRVSRMAGSGGGSGCARRDRTTTAPGGVRRHTRPSLVPAHLPALLRGARRSGVAAHSPSSAPSCPCGTSSASSGGCEPPRGTGR
jgi:hypothetical protein